MLTDILLDNFVTLSLILGLGIVIFSSSSLDKQINELLVCFLMVVFLLDMADMADFYLSELPRTSIFRYFTSALGYSLRPMAIIIVLCILMRRKSVHIMVWIPVALLALLAFTSGFTHLMFWFNDVNDFNRGPLGYLPHILSGAYMIALIALTIKMHRQISSYEVFTVAFIAVICTLATAIESLAHAKFLLPGAMSVSCAMYYIFLNVQTYRRDVLTGLLNRRSFYTDAGRLNGHSAVVISADLNGFKELNDTHGHAAGDKALATLGGILMKASGRDYRAYRMGGDEFTLLGKGKNAEDAGKLIEMLRIDLENAGLSAAFGCACTGEDEDFDVVCCLSDARMYEDKKKYRGRDDPRG